MLRPANELEEAEPFEKTGRPIAGWCRRCQEIVPGTTDPPGSTDRRPGGPFCCAPTKKRRRLADRGSQEFFEDAVEGDGVGGDGGGVGAGGELRERARACALLE